MSYTEAELAAGLQRENECAAHFWGTDEPTTPASIICAEDIMRRLLALPKDIVQAGARVLEAEDDLNLRRHDLQRREDELLIGGSPLIDGKNAETRAAQLRQATAVERCRVDLAEREARWVKQHLTLLRDEFSALRAVTRLLERGA